MRAPAFPAAGAAIVDYGQLMTLGPGDSIRFRTPKSPALAIKNDDGTWSGTGVREPMQDHLLWPEISDVMVISAAPVTASLDA